MLKTLKNYQILELVEGFMKIAEMKFSSTKKFSYAMVLNDEAIKPYVKAMREIASPGESYIEYEEKRNEIIKGHAKVDADGNIILNDNRGVVFKSDEEGLIAIDEINALNKEYTEVLEDRNNDIKEYNELLMNDISVNIECVSLDDIPNVIGEDIFLMKLFIHMIG